MINPIRNAILAIPRPLKRAILITFDFLALVFAVWAAYSLRLSRFVMPDSVQLLVMLLAPVTAFPVFVRFGLIVRLSGIFPSGHSGRLPKQFLLQR
jgi:hypothetical protein